MSRKRDDDNVDLTRPAKRTKLMLDDEDTSGEDGQNRDVSGEAYLGASPPRDYLKINKEYAKRFEHNKKREDQQRCKTSPPVPAQILQRPLTPSIVEEKYGRTNGIGGADEASDSDESSSEDESEDDDGLLATEDVDAEIKSTLAAIRSKDPQIYDKSKKFFTDFDPDTVMQGEVDKEKPMYLHDYHRKNLMEGYTGGEVEEDQQSSLPYAQQQDVLKKQLLQEMHAVAENQASGHENGADDDDDDDDEENFLKAKPSAKMEGSTSATERAKSKAMSSSIPDPTIADRDPESYLSNFMSSRAWVPDASSRWQPFDSDDSEDEARADAFEEAYNMRFEDPEQTNENLISHARDITSKFSVRREDPKGRKKAREKEKAIKEETRQHKQEEKARLRNLRIANVEEKVKKIKEAAGLEKSDAIDVAEWEQFLDEGWDNDKWEYEMKKRFGEGYYAEDEEEHFQKNAEDHAKSSKGHGHEPTKPEWDDDIDIKDLVPNYEEDEDTQPPFALTDDEGNAPDEAPVPSSRKVPTKNDRLQSRADTKRASRRQRRQIEALVDTSLSTEPSLLPPTNSSRVNSSTTEIPRFRYRETSPMSFGLTTRDILLASDAQLNQYAGLKKLAAFRDAERKSRDKKRLGKKARLREWRRDTFGDAEGPKGGFKDDDAHTEKDGGDNGDQTGQKGKKRRRGKKKNSTTSGNDAVQTSS